MITKTFFPLSIIFSIFLLLPRDPSSLVIAKQFEKKLVKITDSLYVCKYETTNLDYRTFIKYLKQNNESLYEKCAPDTLVWRQINSYCEPLVEFYHSHPAYNSYPVVGVSYDAALEYCKWLTDMYNSDVERKFMKVVFALPSEKEWVFAASSGVKGRLYPWRDYYLRDKRGEYLCNYTYITDAFVTRDSLGQPTLLSARNAGSHGPANDRAFYTASVESFKPNEFGLYNMSGNVAEMVSEKGIAKGGSWNDYGGDVRIDIQGKYTDASAQVGFRVFMKILER